MNFNFRILTKILMILYLLLLAYWMMFGFGRTSQDEFMYNLRPLSTIRHFLQAQNINSKASIINLVGNIGVFTPFGIALPIIFRFKFLKLYGLFLCGLFALELTQLLSRRGSFDVDDLILNSVGFFIGYWIYGILLKRE